MTVKIVIPFYSARGHTKRLAEALLAGVQQVTNDASLIDVISMTDAHWQQLEEADGLLFGSPTFMGSVAGEYKLFLDQTARRGLWTQQKLVDKMAGGFTVATYPSGDKLNTLVQLAIFAAQYGMIWVNNHDLGPQVSGQENDHNQWGAWLGAMATSIDDKSKLISDTDVANGKKFGFRFAKAVERWCATNTVQRV
jgi:NAD(P)H dehydrogenase (quinone)